MTLKKRMQEMEAAAKPHSIRKSQSLGHTRAFFLGRAFNHWGVTRSSSSVDVHISTKDAGTKLSAVKPPPMRKSHSMGHTRSFFLGQAFSSLSLAAARARSPLSGSATPGEQGRRISARPGSRADTSRPPTSSIMGTTRGEAAQRV